MSGRDPACKENYFPQSQFIDTDFPNNPSFDSVNIMLFRVGSIFCRNYFTPTSTFRLLRAMYYTSSRRCPSGLLGTGKCCESNEPHVGPESAVHASRQRLHIVSDIVLHLWPSLAHCISSTSPSVYVIYSELHATVSATGTCADNPVASGDGVGPSYESKTIGYSSSFLAFGKLTNPGPNCDQQVVEDGFHTIDFSKLYYTPVVTSTVYKSGCAPYVNPRLSLPADLTDVVPAWKTCQPLYYGAFDPPSVLTKASRLAPVPVVAEPTEVTSPPTTAPTTVAVVPGGAAAAQDTPAADTPAATAAANTPPGPQNPINADHRPSSLDPNDRILLSGTIHEVTATPVSLPQGSNPISPNTAADNKDPSNQVSAPTPTAVANTAVNPAAGKEDPSNQALVPGAAIAVNAPAENKALSGNVVVAQGQTLIENGPSTVVGGKAAAYSAGSVYVDSTPVAVPTSASPANIVVAHGQTLTENGPSANLGGKDAEYSSGSIYFGSSAPVAVPKVADTNVVIAQGQTLTENGTPADVGGKAAVYSAGSIYYDSTPVVVPKSSAANIIVAQGQTLTEDGHPAIVGGKTAMYSAGSVYYDSTPVAVSAAAQAGKAASSVVAIGVTFAPTVEAPSLVTAGGILFTPAVQTPSHVVAGGITFNPTLQGPQVTLPPVVAGGINFQPSSANAVAPETLTTLSIGNEPVLHAANGGLVIAGQTIAQGSTTSWLGNVISAGSKVVLDGETHAVTLVTADIVALETPTPLTIDNNPVLRAPNGGMIIAGQTLEQGSTTSLLGHVISAGYSHIILDGTTQAFAPATAYAATLETPSPLAIPNHPVLTAPNGNLIIAGHTIARGASTTLFNQLISANSHQIVINGTTHALAPNTKAILQASPVSATHHAQTTLTPGAAYSSDGSVATYTGSTPSVFTEATMVLVGTASVPALPGQVFVEAAAAAGSGEVMYVLDGGGATPSGLPRNAALASIELVNGATSSSASGAVVSGSASADPVDGGGSRGRSSGLVVGMGFAVGIVHVMGGGMVMM